MPSYENRLNFQLVYGQRPSSNSQPRQWIFLHGLMGFALNFFKIARGLETCDTSLLFDQRGHGSSFHPPTGYSPQDYAEDVNSLRKYLNWARFFLVGHSMGGRTAMMYAHLFPQHLNGLVIEDIGPEARPESLDFFQSLMTSIPTPFPSKALAKKWLLEDFLKTSIGQKGGVTLAQYLYANLAETPHGIDWRFSKEGLLETLKLGRSVDFWPIWQSLNVPILVIRGQHSTDLNPEIFRRMLETNPHARGVEIPQSGHWVHFDQPEAFTEAVLQWAKYVMKEPS